MLDRSGPGQRRVHSHARSQLSIFQLYASVKETDAATGPFYRELDGGVGLVKIRYENFQVCLTIAPDGKDVVDVPPPNGGLHTGIVQKLSFKLSHKEVGIGGGHTCTYCCAVDLEVVLFPENKSNLVQDLRDQLCQVRCWW